MAQSKALLRRNSTNNSNAIKEFVAKWKERGSERQDAETFWIELVGLVFGVTDSADYFEKQKPTTVELFTEDDKATKKSIDLFVRNSHCVIEHKSSSISLDKKNRQSDGVLLNAMQQAQRYYNSLNQPEQGRYIIVCNFKEFRILDNYNKQEILTCFKLEDLPKKWKLLRAPLGIVVPVVSEEEKEFATKSASDFVSRLYSALLKQYKEKERRDKDVLHSLNVFCVRVVFCLYADGEGLFNNYQFREFVEHFPANQLQEKFGTLFYALNTEEDKREKHLDSVINSFLHVNGGLFADQKVKVPRINEEVRSLIIQSTDGFTDKEGNVFQWSDISPTNFGCIFESTLDPATRSNNGMHYTSPDNIHRVIDPLFLDDLKSELDDIIALPKQTTREKDTRDNSLMAFRNKLGKLKFLDPACGSGNFLTEAFKSLRLLELKAIAEQPNCEGVLHFDDENKNHFYKVHLEQFYGIEINDFATQVARAALWITDCQTTKLLEYEVGMSCDYLPLKKNNNIHCDDALYLDWTDVVKPRTLNYIIGNPPFIGSQNMSGAQKSALNHAMNATTNRGGKVWKGCGDMDFVCAWYAKAAEYMKSNSKVAAAFVSTNSIAQGLSMSLLWKPLVEHYNAKLLFAWKSFVWENDADTNAHVHCVIEAFRCNCRTGVCRIYEENKEPVECKEINGYLMQAEQLFIKSRGKHFQANENIPPMKFGSMPIDTVEVIDKGTGKKRKVPQLRLSPADRHNLLHKYPELDPYIRRIYGGEEFINNKEAYCIWMWDDTPTSILNHPALRERFELVRQKRENSTRKETRTLARTPYMFGEIRQPVAEYLLVPGTSSENRDCVPMGYCSPKIICSNAAFTIEKCPRWLFGILTSRLHTAWVKAVAGRLKSDFRYSASVVYNNFPFPKNMEGEKLKAIEQTAQMIIESRYKHQGDSLAALYNRTSMPTDLAKAHQLNDKAVFALYSSFGIDSSMTDEEIALVLLRKLDAMTTKNKKPKKRRKSKPKKKTLKETTNKRQTSIIFEENT